jgi:3'-phosphoadenosine 5'-phosphosulfate sulfotransferase (PAPS reductase)/FAD synthetase
MPRPSSQQGSLKDGFPKLKRRRAWSLEHKINHANSLIKRVLNNHRNPIVCWSGGKDSTVLLHLVLQQAPNIDVIYNDTGVEFPETREFVDNIVKDWAIANFHVAKPKKGETFWDISKEYGWPLLGKEQSDNIEIARRRMKRLIESGDLNQPDHRVPINGIGSNEHNTESPDALLQGSGSFEKLSDMERVLVGYDVDISTRCCHYLKERPTKLVEQELGIDCKILGIMASESRRRSLLWIDYGEYYKVKDYFGENKGVWKALPLSVWTEEDIWKYHEQYEIPHCSLYDMGHDRNGCWTCGMGARFGQFKRLRQSHPQLFMYLMTRTEMGRELLRAKVAKNGNNLNMDVAEEWAEEVDISILLVQRPCFFDQF